MTATATPPRRDAAKDAAKLPEFRMPRPHLTQAVIWYPDVDDQSPESARAAIVTEVGDENISVALLWPGVPVLDVKTAVRYAKDPNKESARNVAQGVWAEAREQDLEDGRYRANMEARLSALETRVQELVKAAAPKPPDSLIKE